MPLPASSQQDSRSPVAAPPAKNRFAYFPWRNLIAAAIPMALLVVYMTLTAPDLVPVPEGVKKPFPALTHFLEGACTWCGDNKGTVAGVAAVLLLAGVAFRISAARYYTCLAIVTATCLAISYYTISAPIDRLLWAVEENIPKDHRVPDYATPPPDAEN